MYSEKLHSEIVIDAPISTVFAFLTNPNNIPLVLPGLIENTDIPELPIRQGSEFRFRYQMFGVVTDGTTVVDRIESPTVYEFTTKGGGVSHWRENLIEENGRTRVSVDLEYDPPKSWIEKVQLGAIRTLVPREIEQFLQNLRVLLELQS